MRLTVGPLPPAVYWRRRAVVLGAVFLFLVVIFYSSWGNSDESANKNASGQGQSSGDSPAASEPPAGPADPPDDSGDAGGEEPPSSEPSEAADPPPAPPSIDDGACTDADISVTAVARPASVGKGDAVDLQLKIKNISDRTCSRDVGADKQELFLKSGAATIWSSDSCGTGEGSDVQSFTPNFERSYRITWNGNDDSRCQGGVATGPEAPPGTYQVFARVGTKHSEPVELKVTG